MAFPTIAQLFPAGSIAPATAKSYFSDWLTAILNLLGDGTSAANARQALSANDSIFRNRVINGNLLEDQRNAGAAQTIVAAAALAYCVDRFYAFCTGANVTGQQVAAADLTKRYRFTGAVGVTAIKFGHRIEAANSLDLAGNTCTFSTKQSNSLLGVVTWAAYYATTADAFGTAAAPTRTLIATGNFAVTGVEALYSAQFAVPAAAVTGIEIVLSVGAQTSGTWLSGEVQLEKGAIPAAAISFERVDVAINKARCQRYYEEQFVQFGTFNTASAFQLAQSWHASKRGTPSLVVYADTTPDAKTGLVGNVRNVTSSTNVAATTAAAPDTFAVNFTGANPANWSATVTGSAEL